MFLTKATLTAAVVLALGLLVPAPHSAMFEVDPFAAAAQAPPKVTDEPAASPGTPRKRLIKVPSPVEGVIVMMGPEKNPGDRRLREGDRVKEGELLGRLDDRLARNELAVQKAKLTAAEADYDAAVSTTKEAQARLDRMDRLMVGAGRGAIVSVEDYAAGRLTRDRYSAEEKSKKAGVEVAKLDVERAQINLDKHAIRSPVPGVIRAIYKERGEAVQRLEAVVQIEILGER